MWLPAARSEDKIRFPAARSEDKIRSLAEDVECEHDVRALAVPTDVTDREQVDGLVDAAVAELGGLDTFVNNAGVGRGSGVADLSDEQYRSMIAVKVDGVFYATRAALPHLRDSRGTPVFLGSLAGKHPRRATPSTPPRSGGCAGSPCPWRRRPAPTASP